MFAPVVAGQNTVKIAIADTIYDSGLFLSNQSLGGTGAEGTFVPVAGTNTQDNLIGKIAPEAFTLGDGDDIVTFDDNDTVLYQSVSFGVDDLTIEMRSGAVFWTQTPSTPVISSHFLPPQKSSKNKLSLRQATFSSWAKRFFATSQKPLIQSVQNLGI